MSFCCQYCHGRIFTACTPNLYRHKDNTSTSSVLSPAERDRFHRACHRYWLLCSAIDDIREYNRGLEEVDDEEFDWDGRTMFDIIEKNVQDLIGGIVADYSTEEILELLCVANFCALTLTSLVQGAQARVLTTHAHYRTSVAPLVHCTPNLS